MTAIRRCLLFDVREFQEILFTAEGRPGSIKKHWNIGCVLAFIWFYWFVFELFDVLAFPRNFMKESWDHSVCNMRPHQFDEFIWTVDSKAHECCTAKADANTKLNGQGRHPSHCTSWNPTLLGYSTAPIPLLNPFLGPTWAVQSCLFHYFTTPIPPQELEPKRVRVLKSTQPITRSKTQQG